jgi:uncharacterized membrane protein YqiK
MSAQQTYVVAVILTVIGVVLIGVVIVLGLTFWYCTTNPNALLVKACDNGSLRDVAIALIGAVTALWGAKQLRGH